MSKEPELKLCPFYSLCSGKGVLVHFTKDFYVYCANCGRPTDTYKTKAEAIKAWNSVEQEA